MSLNFEVKPDHVTVRNGLFKIGRISGRCGKYRFIPKTGTALTAYELRKVSDKVAVLNDPDADLEDLRDPRNGQAITILMVAAVLVIVTFGLLGLFVSKMFMAPVVVMVAGAGVGLYHWWNVNRIIESDIPDE